MKAAPEPAAEERPEPPSPTLGTAAAFWLRIGCVSFGGPAGQIALLHREVVERRRWMGEEQFQRALGFCVLLPGPEAQQLAAYIGWRLNGVAGGVLAGTLFWLPAAVLLWALSWLYVRHGQLGPIQSVLWGLKPAVLALIAAAGTNIARRVVRGAREAITALVALGAVAGFGLSFPLVVAAAGVWGWFQSGRTGDAATSPPAKAGGQMTTVELVRATVGRVLVWLLVWWLPLVAAGLATGWSHAVGRQALFFSQAAMVTFGGAYAVLPYVARHAVEVQGWLGPGQLIDGLALGETTPGPLVIVLQFIGFLGGWNQPGDWPPLVSATLGAAVTSWATFTPSLLWIFAGAPWMERFGASARWREALRFVSAAVLGAMAWMAILLAGPVWWPKGSPVTSAPDLPAIALALAAWYALARRGWGSVPVIAACALTGILRAWGGR